MQIQCRERCSSPIELSHAIRPTSDLPIKVRDLCLSPINTISEIPIYRGKIERNASIKSQYMRQSGQLLETADNNAIEAMSTNGMLYVPIGITDNTPIPKEWPIFLREIAYLNRLRPPELRSSYMDSN